MKAQFKKNDSQYIFIERVTFYVYKMCYEGSFSYKRLCRMICFCLIDQHLICSGDSRISNVGSLTVMPF